MTLEITGRLIAKYDTQVVSERFKKREFVLELVDDTANGSYTNYAKMQLVQNKTDLVDRFNEGDMLKVSFNIKGSRYDKDGRTSYFTNLDAWRIEISDGSAGSSSGEGSMGGYENSAPTGGYNAGPSYSSGGGSNSGSGFYTPTPTSEPADDLPF
jgi:hypothetical protein